MNPSDASRTAVATSLMRALHTRGDPVPLLNDPWGDRLIPDAVRIALRERALQSVDASRRFEAAEAPDKILDAALRANPAYADVILRSRYTEDALKAAVAQGVAQYVIIGAGFDSFICRRPAWAEGLTIYEVDHPATQRMKRQCLQRCGVPESADVHFVEADLAVETLGSALGRSSFQTMQPTFFSWLGVTMYLTREANLATLRAIASYAPAGSELVFTYVDEAILCDADHEEVESFRRLRSKVASVGEAFLSGFDPATLKAVLLDAGLLLVEDFDGDHALARYDAAGTSGLQPARAAHIAHARLVSGAMSAL
ncbi:class I SAM-dependent methyltransferase [Variovorax sp. CCNWLW235]|uniref:class I SAM-dependent methyltransferase n=1 Tax=Variovorax sp. CCNWLW235 TaxID=3127463 RepID=UPI0030786A5A